MYFRGGNSQTKSVLPWELSDFGFSCPNEERFDPGQGIGTGSWYLLILTWYLLILTWHLTILWELRWDLTCDLLKCVSLGWGLIDWLGTCCIFEMCWFWLRHRSLIQHVNLQLWTWQCYCNRWSVVTEAWEVDYSAKRKRLSACNHSQEQRIYKEEEWKQCVSYCSAQFNLLFHSCCGQKVVY